MSDLHDDNAAISAALDEVLPAPLEDGPVPKVKWVSSCCSRCRKPRDTTSFHPRQHYCKECQKAYRREWYQSKPDSDRIEWRRRQGSWAQRKADEKRRAERHWEIRLEMIAAYGGKCSCCGVTEPQFLTLEHLKGGGRKARKRLHKSAFIYLELKRLGWPQDDYTCLCYNCNSAKGHYGICPHEQQRRIAA